MTLEASRKNQRMQFRRSERYPNDSGYRNIILRLDSSDRDSPLTPVSPHERVRLMASENAVVVFSLSSCCMCTVVKRLFCSLGVSPAVHELDEEHRGEEMHAVLYRLVGNQPVPAVFVGGKLVGGLESVVSSHINGSLVPLLKEAGALWL